VSPQFKVGLLVLLGVAAGSFLYWFAVVMMR